MITLDPTVDAVGLAVRLRHAPMSGPRKAAADGGGVYLLPRIRVRGADVELAPVWNLAGDAAPGAFDPIAGVSVADVRDAGRILDLAADPPLLTGGAVGHGWLVRPGGHATPIAVIDAQQGAEPSVMLARGVDDVTVGDWIQWARWSATIPDLATQSGQFTGSVAYIDRSGIERRDPVSIKVLRPGQTRWAPGVDDAALVERHERFAEASPAGGGFGAVIRAAEREAIDAIQAWGRGYSPDRDEDDVAGGERFAEAIIEIAAWRIARDLSLSGQGIDPAIVTQYRRAADKALAAALAAFDTDVDDDGEVSPDERESAPPGGTIAARLRTDGLFHRPAERQRNAGRRRLYPWSAS